MKYPPPHNDPAHEPLSGDLVLDPDVQALCDEVARECTGQDVRAVALMGSHARGDAHPESDVDILAIGDGPDYRLERRRGRLLALTWQTEERVRAGLLNPAEAGWRVPGWRSAVLLCDPDGVGHGIRREAIMWSWSEIDDECNRWVADEVAGLAEEVHKLVVAVDRGKRLNAAVQRNVLALRLPAIVSVHRRMLYDTENVLWEVVADEMGDAWTRAHTMALGDADTPLDASSAAALELYALAAGEVRALFDATQLAVVAHACELAGHPDALNAPITRS